MGIKPTFTRADIDRDLDAFREKVESDLFKILAYVGEEFVKEARQMTKADGGFGDITGNLRSSIGYFILKDGKIVKENLKGSAGIGKSAARIALNGVEKRDGYQLVGVAGMDYASKVESKGLNVISVQADTAIINLERILDKYADSLNKIGVSMERFSDDGETVSTTFR